MWGFPKLVVPFWGGTSNEDCIKLGSLLGSPYLWKLPFMGSQPLILNRVVEVSDFLDLLGERFGTLDLAWRDPSLHGFWGVGFRVLDIGFRVQGFGFRVGG